MQFFKDVFLWMYAKYDGIGFRHITSHYLIIIMKSLSIFVALWIAAYSISIPVNSQQDKCMVVYSTSAQDFLKIDITFSKFPAQTDSEYYLVSLHNTETNYVESFNVTDGQFRREIQLTENVIYKLCFRIILNRYGSGQMQRFIEYNTAVRHNVYSDTKIQIPQNLLKIKDLQNTYTELINLNRQVVTINEQAKSYQQQQEDVFKQQQVKVKEIEWITIIEFIAIAAFGAYQYFRLTGIVDNKQRG